MTPFEYLSAVQSNQNNPEVLKKVFNESKNFHFYNKHMHNEDIVYSPHDGIIHKMKFHKNGILELKISTLIYSETSAEQLDNYQLFDLVMKVEKITDGLHLKTGSIIMDMKFNENEFAIHFLDKNDHSKHYIESIEISSIDVSKSGILKPSYNKYVPKEYRKKLA